MMQKSCLSSSAASSSVSCTSLQSSVSCKNFAESMEGYSAQRPLPDHGNGNLECMCEGDLNPKTYLKPRPRELLEEGEGECHGEHVSSAVNGLPSLWDNSDDSIRTSWRRLSPAAASCFCKDIEEEQEYFQQVLGSSSHGWTDEKHSSYLDSMEADFLKSVMFNGRDVLQTEPTSDLDDSASSHQAKASAKEFKVCQSGKWRPVLVQASFVNVGPLKQLAVAVKNPWIKRFRAPRRANNPSLIMEDRLLEEANACCRSQEHE